MLEGAAVEDATGAAAVELPAMTVTAESVGVAAASVAVTVTVTYEIVSEIGQSKFRY